MSENGTGPARVSVYFGGTAHEIWTNSGLSVSYTGRHEVCAARDGAVYRAEAPVPARSGDVKADYNELAKSEELAVSLNSGTAPPLTRAYFNAAAAAAEAFSGLWDLRDLPGRLPRELSGDGLYLWYPESDEIICNASFHAMLGFREHDFPRTMEEYVRTMVHPDDNDVFIIQKKIAQSPQYGNYFESCQRIKHKDGRYLWMIGRGMVIERDSQGHALKIIGSRTNINLMQSNFDNIKLMMFTDSLTGLHNRNYFQQQAMRYIDPRVQPLSIIFIDVSGLKLTNDILGHSYGDYLLIKTCELITQALSEIISARPVDVKARAQRIIMNEVLTSDLNRTDPAAAPAASASQAPAPSASQLAPTQLSLPSAASGTKGEEQLGKSEVMRLAGDEFLVLLPNCPLEQAQRLAQRIEELRVHNNTYHRDNSAIAVRPVPVYFGIGVATMGEAKFEQAAVSGERAPTDDDLRQLIDRADARMQASKEAHRDRDYRELKTYFEAKKGRAVSMRDDRRLKILTEEEREQLRAHRVSRIIF